MPTRKIYRIFTYDKFLYNEIRIVLEKSFILNSKEELLREENKLIEHSLEDPKCLNAQRAVINYEVNKQNQKNIDLHISKN